MSRVNMSHDYKSVLTLAIHLEELSAELRTLSGRLKKDLGPKGKIKLAHQVSIENGVLAIRKFVREADTKLDTRADSGGVFG